MASPSERTTSDMRQNPNPDHPPDPISPEPNPLPSPTPSIQNPPLSLLSVPSPFSRFRLVSLHAHGNRACLHRASLPVSSIDLMLLNPPTRPYYSPQSEPVLHTSGLMARQSKGPAPFGVEPSASDSAKSPRRRITQKPLKFISLSHAATTPRTRKSPSGIAVKYHLSGSASR